MILNNQSDYKKENHPQYCRQCGKELSNKYHATECRECFHKRGSALTKRQRQCQRFKEQRANRKITEIEIDFGKITIGKGEMVEIEFGKPERKRGNNE